MRHSAANVIVLEPRPARHIAPSPGAGGSVLPMKKQRKKGGAGGGNMRYAGLMSVNNRHRRKYDPKLRVRIAGGEARRLTEREIEEWYERLGEVMDGKSEVRCQPLGCDEVV